MPRGKQFTAEQIIEKVPDESGQKWCAGAYLGPVFEVREGRVTWRTSRSLAGKWLRKCH